MNPNDIYHVVIQAIKALENLHVEYELGGSLASMVHGVPRNTLDADLVADLRLDQVEPLVLALGKDFIADSEAMRAAIKKKRSFNILHYESMLKVDIFPVKATAFSRVEFSRRVKAILPGTRGKEIWCSSPEDIVLNKLSWYLASGKVSDRQWTDVLGVLGVQKDQLDRAYMEHWAEELGVLVLLKKALSEAGMD